MRVRCFPNWRRSNSSPLPAVRGCASIIHSTTLFAVMSLPPSMVIKLVFARPGTPSVKHMARHYHHEEVVVLQKMLGADKALSVLRRHWHLRQAASLDLWRHLAAATAQSRHAELAHHGVRAEAEARAERAEEQLVTVQMRLTELERAHAVELERTQQLHTSERRLAEEDARQEAEKQLADEVRRRRRAEEATLDAESGREAEARRRREAESQRDDAISRSERAERRAAEASELQSRLAEESSRRHEAEQRCAQSERNLEAASEAASAELEAARAETRRALREAASLSGQEEDARQAAAREVARLRDEIAALQDELGSEATRRRRTEEGGRRAQQELQALRMERRGQQEAARAEADAFHRQLHGALSRADDHDENSAPSAWGARTHPTRPKSADSPSDERRRAAQRGSGGEQRGRGWQDSLRQQDGPGSPSARSPQHKGVRGSPRSGGAGGGGGDGSNNGGAVAHRLGRLLEVAVSVHLGISLRRWWQGAWAMAQGGTGEATLRGGVGMAAKAREADEHDMHSMASALLEAEATALRCEAEGRVAQLRLVLRGAERREDHARLARALGCWHVYLCVGAVLRLEELGRWRGRAAALAWAQLSTVGRRLAIAMALLGWYRATYATTAPYAVPLPAPAATSKRGEPSPAASPIASPSASPNASPSAPSHTPNRPTSSGARLPGGSARAPQHGVSKPSVKSSSISGRGVAPMVGADGVSGPHVLDRARRIVRGEVATPHKAGGGARV